MKPSVLRAAPDGTPLVWARGESVLKKVFEPVPEIVIPLLAAARGVSHYVAPLVGIVDAKQPSERGLPVKNIPKGVVVTMKPKYAERSIRLPLKKSTLWAVTEAPLLPGVAIEMKHCGPDLEMMAKAGMTLQRQLELASQTIRAVANLCSAGLWPTDIKLSNLAQMPQGQVVLLDYRGVWAPHTGVPAISSIVVQTLYHRTSIHSVLPLLGEFSDQTLGDSDGQFIVVPNVATTVALATKLAVSELFGFQDQWKAFDRAIDDQIASLNGPPAKVCIANNPNELLEFRLFVSPRTPFLER